MFVWIWIFEIVFFFGIWNDHFRFFLLLLCLLLLLFFLSFKFLNFFVSLWCAFINVLIESCSESSFFLLIYLRLWRFLLKIWIIQTHVLIDRLSIWHWLLRLVCFSHLHFLDQLHLSFLSCLLLHHELLLHDLISLIHLILISKLIFPFFNSHQDQLLNQLQHHLNLL